MLCEPRSYPLRVLEEFIRTILNTGGLQRELRASHGYDGMKRELELTSLPVNAFEVKSLTQVLKQRSTRPEYSLIKSCIWL